MYLPPEVDPNNISHTLGLISDTHMPERWPTLPKPIFDLFDGVDLILHAGDVGQLWVLDELAAVAPVIAVHGNDDTAEAQRELPEQQLISVANQRILLWHSHFPDRQKELAFRQFNAWQPKLERQIERAQRAAADIIIHGHTHIPMCTVRNQLMIINPGAIASGNYFSRQLIQSVALLYLLRNGRRHVLHFNLALPDQPFKPDIDWEGGFRKTAVQYETTIATPELIAVCKRIHKELNLQQPDLFKEAILRLAHGRWAGDQRLMTRVELAAEVEGDADFSTSDRERLVSMLRS